jgi:DNA-directed RNA polymerase subunit M/transcription elongation factor TFIIS
MKTYNVWVHIEQVDESLDDYQDIGEPISVGKFDSLEEAVKLRDKLIGTVDDACPKCGADSNQREFMDKRFLDCEAIQMIYTCKNCGSEIIEEFTLSEVFIDSGK